MRLCWRGSLALILDERYCFLRYVELCLSSSWSPGVTCHGLMNMVVLFMMSTSISSIDKFAAAEVRYHSQKNTENYRGLCLLSLK